VPMGSSAGVGAGVDLKDPEEVKEYLDNLGIEYRFACYQEKDPKACHMLGDYLEGIKKDFIKALRIYTTNCNEYKNGHSCHKVGGYKYIGKACKKDADEAYDYFKKGCDLGHHASCMNAGLLDMANPDSQSYERTTAPNPDLARSYYKQACEKGELAEACHRYSAIFIKGLQGVCEKDMTEAFKYSKKACELGNMAGCNNVSMMYAKGEGVDKDPVASKEYGYIAAEMMAQLRQEQARIAKEERG